MVLFDNILLLYQGLRGISLTFVTILHALCYYSRRVEDKAKHIIIHKDQRSKSMTHAIKKARPIVEATVISIALVIAALAVPAGIVYIAA